ncbi:MAG: 50S ribosomal protein L35 [Chloroflexota bacterium]|nr:MAG: 50S ribosomal protein L35 [Chloroflexota bacterium]
MPKMKTHKGTAKRFKFSGTGKLMRTHHMKSHLRRNKSKRMLRQLDEMQVVFKGDVRRIASLIPYSA